MNTPNAATKAPEIKLYKVGKDRERKKGGAAWWLGQRGTGAFLGSSAAESGGIAGLGLWKTIVLLAMAFGACATGAVLGLMSLNSGSHGASDSPKIFADRGGKYDDLSGVVKTNNDIPNSLGYVSGSADGLTPEERARRKAEEEARLAAEAAAKKKADEDAAAAAAAKDAATPPAAPAVAAAPANPGGGLQGGRFGHMSGGLSGGSGMSGGIGSSFSSLGNMGHFDKGKKAALGPAMAANAKSGTHGSAHPVGAGLGQAFGQLRKAQSQSSKSAASNGEAASAGASTPFDTNGGTDISGDGITSGSPGSADTPPSGGTGGSAGGSAGGATGPTAPPPSTDNVPWQGELDAAMICLGAIAAAGIIALACKGKLFAEIASEIAEGAMAIAAGALAIIGGIMGFKYGQWGMGAIMLGCAGLTAATCWAANPILCVINSIVAAVAIPIISAMSSSLSSSASGSPNTN